jgi:hypothetical protein
MFTKICRHGVLVCIRMLGFSYRFLGGGCMPLGLVQRVAAKADDGWCMIDVSVSSSNSW